MKMYNSLETKCSYLPKLTYQPTTTPVIVLSNMHNSALILLHIQHCSAQ
uniref:Uncharacterized protein n=1 Tax=Arundo donax TaxID=35708 RepID=A0A0A9C375_ARUDO